MARVAVPVSCLRWDLQDAFPNQVHEVFQGEGAWNPVEEFTFTGRIMLSKHSAAPEQQGDIEAKRARIRERLKEALPDPERYDTLLRFLEENDWDVSFFVDTW